MDETPVTELFYIRHAQSQGNCGGAVNGEDYPLDDPPLTVQGVEQARLCAQRMARGRLDAVYSSPLERAVHTAHEIALLQGGMPVIILPDLMEEGTSHLTAGCPVNKLKAEYPLAVPAVSEPSLTGGALTLPQNESYEQATQRAKRVVDYIRAHHTGGQRAALVSHGGFFGFVMRYALALGDEDVFRWSINNTSVTKIKYYPTKKPKLSYANDTTHLAAMFPDWTYTI